MSEHYIRYVRLAACGKSHQIQNSPFQAAVKQATADAELRYAGNPTPHRCDEGYLPANHRAGSPVTAVDKRRRIQMKDSN